MGARTSGFTLIEMLVVMAVVALLLSIAVPSYMRHLQRSQEAVLKENLAVMRDAIDKYSADKGRFPDSLADLVKARYLRTIPVDPITDRADTWVAVADKQVTLGVADVRSGAPGLSLDGSDYSTW